MVILLSLFLLSLARAQPVVLPANLTHADSFAFNVTLPAGTTSYWQLQLGRATAAQVTVAPPLPDGVELHVLDESLHKLANDTLPLMAAGSDVIVSLTSTASSAINVTSSLLVSNRFSLAVMTPADASSTIILHGGGATGWASLPAVQLAFAMEGNCSGPVTLTAFASRTNFVTQRAALAVNCAGGASVPAFAVQAGETVFFRVVTVAGAGFSSSASLSVTQQLYLSVSDVEVPLQQQFSLVEGDMRFYSLPQAASSSHVVSIRSDGDQLRALLYYSLLQPKANKTTWRDWRSDATYVSGGSIALPPLRFFVGIYCHRDSGCDDNALSVTVAVGTAVSPPFTQRTTHVGEAYQISWPAHHELFLENVNGWMVIRSTTLAVAHTLSLPAGLTATSGLFLPSRTRQSMQVLLSPPAIAANTVYQLDTSSSLPALLKFQLSATDAFILLWRDAGYSPSFRCEADEWPSSPASWYYYDGGSARYETTADGHDVLALRLPAASVMHCIVWQVRQGSSYRIWTSPNLAIPFDTPDSDGDGDDSADSSSRRSSNPNVIAAAIVLPIIAVFLCLALWLSYENNRQAVHPGSAEKEEEQGPEEAIDVEEEAVEEDRDNNNASELQAAAAVRVDA